MLRIKRGDQVQVIAGADKGKRGEVLDVDVSGGRIKVQGINVRYRHVKKSQQFPEGGRIQQEVPIHYSNVALIDPDSGKPTRIKAGTDSNGKKIRVSAKSGKPV